MHGQDIRGARGNVELLETINQTKAHMKLNATVELMLITPELASEWFADLWGDQRSIKQPHLAKLVSDMNAGRFHLGPDAILRIGGKLANGQHRLKAVMISGKAQRFIVMQTDDLELYKVIDCGLRRTVGDALIGFPYAHRLSPIARWLMGYELKTLGYNQDSGDHGVSSTVRPSQCQVIEYCEDNKDILSEAARYVDPLYEETKLLSKSVAAALFVIASRKNGCLPKVKTFLEHVYKGGGNSAAEDLRNRLISCKGGKAKLRPGYIFAISIKALKSYCNGTRPGNLRFSKDEEFPVL